MVSEFTDLGSPISRLAPSARRTLTLGYGVIPSLCGALPNCDKNVKYTSTSLALLLNLILPGVPGLALVFGGGLGCGQSTNNRYDGGVGWQSNTCETLAVIKKEMMIDVLW